METYACVILGAGGHARVLIEALRAQGEEGPIAALDIDQEIWGATILGVPVLGGDHLLPELKAAGAGRFAVGLGAVKNNMPRRGLFLQALALGLEPVTVIHPAAWVSPSAELAPGCQIMAGAIVHASARLGSNVVVNTRAVVEHDCIVGEHAHVASGAVVCSGCKLGEGVHIGAGAVVRQVLSIGNWAVVGAGAAVVKDVSDETVVVGVPARPVQ